MRENSAIVSSYMELLRASTYICLFTHTTVAI